MQGIIFGFLLLAACMCIDLFCHENCCVWVLAPASRESAESAMLGRQRPPYEGLFYKEKAQAILHLRSGIAASHLAPRSAASPAGLPNDPSGQNAAIPIFPRCIQH